MATFYSDGITQRRNCYMGKAMMESIVLKGERGYNILKSAIRRIDQNDQIAGLNFGGIPILIYHTNEETTITAFYDQRNAAIEISARNPSRIIASASKIGLPIDELTLMLSNPERFDSRTNY